MNKNEIKAVSKQLEAAFISFLLKVVSIHILAKTYNFFTPILNML